MRNGLRLLLMAWLAGLLWVPARAASLSGGAPASGAGGLSSRPDPVSARGRAPGVAAAETLSQITGIAISPLLGVSAVGAYQYLRTPAEQRPRLSWYAQPWFWVPALLLVALCFAKDAAGPVVPTALKKPFDVAEVFENKLSGLIATGAVVPLVLDMFRSLPPGAALSGAGFAAIDLAGIGGVLMVPFALAAYAAVFLVSHAINILILISPFTTVDTALKTFRLMVLGTVTGAGWAGGDLAAVWCGLIILLCLPLAGWAFRLAVFGQVFAWDLVTLRRMRTRVHPTSNRVFLARRLGRAPRRSYGVLARNAAGGLQFTYRPWLVLAPRSVSLPDGRYAVGRGLLHPELLREEDGVFDDLLDLPPRYRTHEAELAACYGIAEVRDVGLRAAWSWLRSLFTGRPVPA